MSESVQHKMDVTDLDHGRTRFYPTLIVLTVPSVSTLPGVRPLNHPEFRPTLTAASTFEPVRKKRPD